MSKKINKINPLISLRVDGERNRHGRLSRTINEFVKECHAIAKDKGWWQEERNDAELIALMHSELSEALEAMRNHGNKENVAEELADCCIRIFDYCGARDINLEEILLKKMEFNKNRPYRHGKKF